MKRVIIIVGLLVGAFIACDPAQPCTWAVPIYEQRCAAGDAESCMLMHACAPGSCGTPGAPPCG